MRYRRWPSYGVWLRTQQALRAGFSGYWEDEISATVDRLLDHALRGRVTDWTRARADHDLLMTLISRPDISSEP